MITTKQYFTIMLKVNKIMECTIAMANKATERTTIEVDNALEELALYIQEEIGLKENDALDRGLITKSQYCEEIGKALEELL